MTSSFLAIIVAVSIVAFMFGWFVAILTAPEHVDHPTSPVEPLDTRLLDHLDRTHVSLFYNEELSAWGVLSGGDKLICSGLTVRSALTRAVDVADAGV